MPRARKHLISLEATPYYHCVSRCVRRAYLCGRDKYSNRNYEHRREWVESRILELGQAMCVDVLAYSVMENHLHVVLRADDNLASSLTPAEVIERWHQLYRGSALSNRFIEGDTLTDHENDLLQETVQIWRERLFDISWFMRALNEPIARRANIEDECKGRFWESRFTSQALVGNEALLSCMVYVDLNPVRAGIAGTPESSDYTSIKKRIEAFKHNRPTPTGILSLETEEAPKPASSYHNDGAYSFQDTGFPITLRQYLDLVDSTGRLVKSGKRGKIDSSLPPILDRLNMSIRTWKIVSTGFESQFYAIAGTAESMTRAAQILGLKRRAGISRAKQLFY